ncbi:hypothetical protein YSA_03561 [Pseudomonas putida ND6]|uniref:Uncharacterized protein n=1 Tax=Pseudomonas putida ND6 TaxID=231023 RepID=I3UT72_PSEPU|nr:hypothetical protein YSA_03561 [Pseudomonas putida ND6]
MGHRCRRHEECDAESEADSSSLNLLGIMDITAASTYATCDANFSAP